MHEQIEKAIKENTAASVRESLVITTLLDWLKSNKGAATGEQVEQLKLQMSSMHTDLLSAVEDVYHKLKNTDLKAMEKRIIEAIKGDSDAVIAKATQDLKAATDPLEKAVADNQKTSP